MLSTPWSRSFGLRVPILNAPMGGVAGGRLAAAVGQGVEMVSDDAPVGEVIEQMCAGAESLLAGGGRRL
jgi:hypothetical protein